MQVKNYKKYVKLLAFFGLITVTANPLVWSQTVPPGVQANANDQSIFEVAPQECEISKGKFIWNLEEAKLGDVLRQIAQILCRNIVVPDGVNVDNVKVTIVGKTPISPSDAWNVLLASMAARGLTIIKQGENWVVSKLSDAKSHATPFHTNIRRVADNQAISTFFYKAKHQSPETLKNITQKLISRDETVEVTGDYLLVIATGSNIKRIAKIFDAVDIEDAVNKIHFIKLQHADPKTVEKQLRDIFEISSSPYGRRRRRPPGGGSDDKNGVNIEKIIALERIGGILYVADDSAKPHVQKVIDMMDQPADDKGGKGKVYVVRLKHADAEKLAETLREVIDEGRRRPRFPRRRDEDTGEVFEGDVRISPHGSFLVITAANPSDFQSLNRTIAQLDIKKEQVYVEMVIMDIGVSDNNEFGVNLFAGMNPSIPGVGNATGVLGNPGGNAMAKGIKDSATQASALASSFGEQGLGALALLNNFLSGGSGIVGLVGDPIKEGSPIPSFGAVLKALSSHSNVDVLSTPYLLTTDNEEAEMSVGEKVPVIKGASSVGGGQGAGSGLGIPMQNVQYEPVELKLKITPHVGAEDNVRLEIEQEVNELGQAVKIFDQEQYRIRTKTAKSTIVLKDQQTGVIGGLIQHKSSQVDQKTPFLGDIPIIGWLFKNRSKKNDRKSLVVILTPYIIKTELDYKKIVERKLKEREEFAKLYYGGKIRKYNKYVDYSKKTGPLSSTILKMESEMEKIENGGTGNGEDTLIMPTNEKKGMSSSENKTQNSMKQEQG